MSGWHLMLRYAVNAIVFALTIWAFSTGQMLLAVIGVAACALAWSSTPFLTVASMSC